MEFDLNALKEQANGFILRKAVVLDETQWTPELIMTVGVRTLLREVDWQEKHGSQAKTNRIKELEAKVAELEAQMA